MLLADHAQCAEGKLFISGGGVNLVGPGPTPLALAIHIRMPWHDMNRKHKFVVELMDSDGQPVEIETPDGLSPLRIEGDFSTTPGPEQRPGSELVASLAANFGPLPLAPDSGYVWTLSINGKSRDEWRLPFRTRALPFQQAS
jgi:hypothetical protein